MFRKAAAGELAEDSGLSRLAALTNVDVGQVGVTGAANFFESKVRAFFVVVSFSRNRLDVLTDCE